MSRIEVEQDGRMEQARLRFGQMLRRWRAQNGWSGKTPGAWHRECPDLLPLQVASATWTNFETGKAMAPNPETFVALELLNDAVFRGETGAVHDLVLRERVTGAKPIVHPDGSPWRAGDFFNAFIGAIDPPEHLRPPEFDPTRRGDEFRAAFRGVTKREQLRPVTALLQLMRFMPGATPSQQVEVEAVVMDDAPFQTEEGAELAMEGLGRWTRDLERAAIRSGV
jgi:hypothetical protein